LKGKALTNRFRTVSAVAIFALALLSAAGAAEKTPIAVARVFSAAGAAGCTVTGATVTTGTTPSVITCAAAHNLQTGDQVQITGIVGTTTDNVTAYVSVLSTTTFSIFSDINLTAGIIGTGTYSSGGAVSQAFNIASGPRTQRFTCESTR
jgi:Ubiquitin-activating enzyme E1 FCCH domain